MMGTENISASLMMNGTTDFPLVIILLLTYASTDERTEYALRTVRQTKENLGYPNIKWWLADAGDSRENFDIIKGEISGIWLQGWHSLPGASAGYNWNYGIHEALNLTDFYIRLEDDWVPQYPIDITPFVQMLQFRDDIGMVRLGYQHVPADMEAIGINGIHYYRYKKSTPFCYGGHPAIIHKRFHEAYGYNDEEKNPGEVEIDMDWRVRNTPGPEIVRPAEIGGWGAFAHIGEKKGY